MMEKLDDVSQYKQFGIKHLLFYTLLPALLILGSFVFMLQFKEEIAPFTSFMLIIFFILIPVELGIIGIYSYAESGKFNLSSALHRHEKISFKKMIVPAFLVCMIVAFSFGVLSPLEWNILGKKIFGFVPEYAKLSDYLNQYKEFSRGEVYATLLLYVVGNGIIAPIVEELYFRGFLLARMERFKNISPFVNAVLFSFYHLFSPWEFVTRIIGCFPFILYDYKKRNIVFGMLVHVTMNLFSVIMLSRIILSSM